MVVLTVGNAYLLCIADAARIDAVNAELATSKVSLDQATASHDAGISPRLDVLRAQVDYQNEQQSLISGDEPTGEGQAGAGARHRPAAGPGVSA